MKTSDDVARLVEAELRRLEHGFGPNKPWGLVPLSGHEMGSEWFRSLEEAAKRSIG